MVDELFLKSGICIKDFGGETHFGEHRVQERSDDLVEVTKKTMKQFLAKYVFFRLAPKNSKQCYFTMGIQQRKSGTYFLFLEKKKGK